MIIEAAFVDAKEAYGMCQVEIEGDKIIRVGKSLTCSPDLQFKPNVILVPGIIDLHTHLRYGQDYKEDINTGTRAAINGGVVRLMDMPNNPKGFAPVDRGSYLKKQEWAKQGHVPVHLYAGIGPNTRPFAEATHYKVFMAESVGDLFFEDLETLDATLDNYRGCQVTFHCEDPQVLKKCADKETHEKRRPAAAEAKAVKNAIMLGKKYSLDVLIAHVSCEDSLYYIHSFGEDVKIEVAPHYLIFNDRNKDSMRNAKLIKMNPAIRSTVDMGSLVQALRAGFVHNVGSDHAPHTLEEKLDKNPSGIPGLDHMGQILGYLHLTYNIPLTTLCEVFSYNPAGFLGVKHGLIMPDNEASFTAIDLGNCKEISSKDVQTKAGFSAYEGMVMPTVPFVMAQGRILKRDGQLMINNG
jgi:dihydroorotase